MRELLDSSGAAFALYCYDSYGRPTETTTTGTARISADTAAAIAAAQPLRYASYVYDSESGYYYCSARYYDPVVGAFVFKDPAKADGEESAYQYCGGEPVGRTDPSGSRWIGRRVQKDKQKDPRWWAACSVAVIKRVLGKKAKGLSQEWCAEWVFEHGGAPAGTVGPYPSFGVSSEYIAKLWRSQGLKHAKVQRTFKLGDLKRRLRRYPICVMTTNAKDENHFVVLERVASDKSGKLEYMDPLYGKHRYATFSQFGNGFYPHRGAHLKVHWDQTVVVR